MNLSAAIFLVNSDVRAINVVYEPQDEQTGKCYTFKTLDQSIKKGDFVVTPSSTRHGMTVCKVVEINVDIDHANPSVSYKWIVGKIDVAAYEKILGLEASAIDVVRKVTFEKKRRELAADLQSMGEAQLKALEIYKE